MTRDDIQATEFWDGRICLDCEAPQSAEAELDQPCEVCGKDAVLSASTILRCVDLVED